MGRPYIVAGDATSHGGYVLDGTPFTNINGRAVARKGDKVFCPLCQGVFAINSGAEDYLIDGLPLARHGDTTECGATLIGSQTLALYYGAGGEGSNHSVGIDHDTSAAATLVAVPSDGGICLECLVKAAAAGNATVARG